MPGTPEVLQGRSSARREILDAPQDDLALTFDDVAAMVFDDLDANDGPAPATRETLQSISAALRESLA
jgi:hypothetical protein